MIFSPQRLNLISILICTFLIFMHLFIFMRNEQPAAGPHIESAQSGWAQDSHSTLKTDQAGHRVIFVIVVRFDCRSH